MTEIDKWLEILKGGKCIPEKEMKKLCDMAKTLLVEEPNVIPVQTPVTVGGDIHGQLQDLLELFKTGGDPEKTNYVLMGDYVDRGYHSIETFELLLCFKVKYPHKITLLRGNHESRVSTQVYGLYDEILRKYGNANPWRYCTEVFDCLAIAAIIDSRIFCVHAGLSPQIGTIDAITFNYYLIYLLINN